MHLFQLPLFTILIGSQKQKEYTYISTPHDNKKTSLVTKG